MKRHKVVVVIAIVLASATSLTVAAAAEAPSCQVTTDAFCYQPVAEKLVQRIQAVTEPNIATPSWLGAGQ